MKLDRCSLVINSFIKCHSSYCPLIWMFCNRKSMKKVNKIQERCLRLMTNNYKLSYEELLVLTSEIYPHQQCSNELSLDIMNDVLAVSKH